MAHYLGNYSEPSKFYERIIWQKAKELALARTWIYVLKDTDHWKKN
jgi:hypothetical protein